MNKRIKYVFDVLLVGYAALAILVFLVVAMPASDYRSGVVNLATAARLSIATDKSEYSLGEDVKILMVNRADNPLTQNIESNIEVSADRILGGIYGVGLIEKMIDGQWLAIEPVWRCNNSCYAECGREDFVELEKIKEFVWGQKKLVCDQSLREEKQEEVGVGEYRISSAIQGRDSGDYEIVYSNIFVVK